MKIMYATLEDGYSTHKLKEADIPKHAAIFVKIAGDLFRIDQEGDDLSVQVQQQIVVRPGVSNSVRLRMEPFSK